MKINFLLAFLLIRIYFINAATIQTNADDVRAIINKIESLEGSPEKRLIYISQIDHLYVEFYAQQLYPYIKREYDGGSTIEDLNIKFDLYHLMEAVYYAFPNYQKAAPIAYQLLDIATITQDSLHAYFAYSSIGADEEGLRGSVEALEFYLKAHEFASIDPVLYAKSSIELATIFVEMGKYGKAESYLNTAVKIAKQEQNLIMLSYAYATLTDYNSEKGDIDKTLYYFKKVDSIIVEYPEFRDSRDYLSGAMAASKAYLERGDLSAANKLLRISKQLALLSGDLQYQSQVYTLLHDFELAKGDYEQALNYFKTSATLEDSIYRQETISQLNSLKISYEVNQKDIELKSAILAGSFEKKQKWLILIIFVIAMISLGLGLLHIINKLKASKVSEQLSQKENKLKQTEIKNLALEVQLKNKELANLFLKQYEKAQKVTNLVRDMGSHETTKIDLLKQLDQNTDWTNFKVHFDKIDEGFFEKLQQVSDKLTAKDLRYCAYIRMNLTSKEIAIMLGISHRTVEGIRGRVRKKLGLKSSEDIVLYLMNL